MTAVTEEILLGFVYTEERNAHHDMRQFFKRKCDSLRLELELKVRPTYSHIKWLLSLATGTYPIGPNMRADKKLKSTVSNELYPN